MAVTDWDEQRLSALYRRYQLERDGIPWSRYKPIVDAAREMQAEAEAEIRMAAISEQAAKMEFQQDRTEVIDWSSSSDRAKSRGLFAELKESLMQSVESLMDSVNPARWVPVAVTAVLLVVVVPFVIKTGPDHSGGIGLVAKYSEQLQQNASAVSSELGALNEMQMGFSSASSEFASAFQSGLLFIDLISLSEKADDPQLQQVAESIRKGLGESEVTQQSMDTSQLAALGDRLQAHYSNSSYSSVFALGQWVETGYLLAGIAKDGGDTGNLLGLLKESDNLASLLEAGGHLSDQLTTEFASIKQLIVSGELNPADLPALSSQLLKMRTVYALH